MSSRTTSEACTDRGSATSASFRCWDSQPLCCVHGNLSTRKYFCLMLESTRLTHRQLLLDRLYQWRRHLFDLRLHLLLARISRDLRIHLRNGFYVPNIRWSISLGCPSVASEICEILLLALRLGFCTWLASWRNIRNVSGRHYHTRPLSSE